MTNDRSGLEVREVMEGEKKIVVVEREKDELQEDRALHKAEATELKRQIG